MEPNPRTFSIGYAIWLCPAISLVLAGAVLLLLGVSWWTALIAAGLLACLIAAAWTLVADRSSRRAIERRLR